MNYHYQKKGYPKGRKSRLLPTNVDEWLIRNEKTEMRRGAQKLATWLKQMPEPRYISNGVAIGKYYGTLILDITHQGSEFSINEFGDIKHHKTEKPIDSRTHLKEILYPKI